MTIDISSGAILLVVGACAFLECSIGLGIILPAETVVLAAAAAAAAGAVNVWAVLAVAWGCAVAGDCCGYWLGRHFGQRLLDRFGPALRLTPERVVKAEAVVHRWGIFGVAAGRFIPAVRILIMPAAGILRMPFTRFLIGDVVGVAGWAALHVSIGNLVGFGLEKHSGQGPLMGILVIAAAVAVGLSIYGRRRRTHSAAAQSTKTQVGGDSRLTITSVDMIRARGRGSYSMPVRCFIDLGSARRRWVPPAMCGSATANVPVLPIELSRWAAAG